MSSFALLDEDYLLNTIPKKSNKKPKPKVLTETIFTKIHLEEIWIVILNYFEIKDLYTVYVLIDRKIRNIIYSLPFQKYLLERTFGKIISTEEERDHAALFIKEGKTLEKEIENMFQLKDPRNIFGFQKKFIPSDMKPEQHLVFQKLYFALLNRRIKFTNRNMKLREQFRSYTSYIYAFQEEYDNFKRSTRKGTKALQAAEQGYGLMDNEHRSEIDNEKRRQLDCDHFMISVSFDPVQTRQCILTCKSCKAEEKLVHRTKEDYRKYL
ncbi:predicted protein [Naegleria gruberi]|uniref:Predicted protein n=1 Tax=Naegleria gruberi TaxID=5762 RepID=D2W055_NAEGR|nr:uncharacterized protein NAEGRDRAFT_53657 [Naegleria gruberi]EFC37556.1 predicted protein [Naegleria gruberi]|eukprot:XP_002670300.1 predicted protein [Naegleria gruberi strain NEG-M]